ncbi:methyltransferase [Micromonospora echinospora]|uniref:methyltransferase n=1 Tax=Micromonospora echinospora TaxID=1877 RepID=UPI003A86E59A
MFDVPFLDVAYREPARLAPDLSGLSDLLREVGFTETTVVELLEALGLQDLLSRSLEYALLSDGTANHLITTAAGLLTQLFVRNGWAPLDVYRARLPIALRHRAEMLGLVSVAGAWVKGHVSISPLSGQHFLSDQLFTLARSGEPSFRRRSDIVMPPHASTMALHDAASRDGAWKHLVDLGCGCGVLAVTLGGSYGMVTAVDCNPRAVAYTRANAILNGVDLMAETVDVTKQRVPVSGSAHLIFNSPTSIPYRPDVGEPGIMSPELALRRVLAQFPTRGPAGGLAQVYMVVEVPNRYGSAEQLVRDWLTGAQFDRVEVREQHDSPVAIPTEMILTRSIEPRCLLLKRGDDAPVLADYLRERGTREVVSAVVSVWV